ncbi:phage major capsid protein [Bacillus cereus]|uniref:phage major capsid protein n=1 Tax=Bacillus cereus TaxID=1396 RepID=UPI001E4A0F13|nr:phage major capsid protein [Bacillus cereus]MCU5475821.1 phage major capsid protein [Bacillus cereus]MCU5613154.1 phage major capsid protein [Bacillus cereus]
MTQLELRQVDVELSGVKQDSGELLVSGYVNKTGQWSQPLGRENRFIERIEPGTFTRALQKGNDVHFLAEHDNAKLLASTKNGSLQLREDDKGLYMEARISPTSWGKDYHQLIQDGLLTNMSFGMQVNEQKWDKRDDGTYKRTISDLTLAEVSVVRNPAYVQSSIQARSIEVIETPVFFMEKNEKKPMEELKMNEKELKELRNKLEMAEARFKEENETAVEVETRDVELNTEETELRAVEQFLRGDTQGSEVRAMTAGSEPGKIFVPTHLSNVIIKKLSENAPLFARTKNFTPVAGHLDILCEGNIGTADFVTELSPINTSEFSMNKVTLTQKRAGTAIELSQQLINDSGINIVDYAVNVLSRRLGLKIDASILIGDNATEFEGILKDDVKILPQVAKSATEIEIDELLDLHNLMHPFYLEGSVWVMNRKTFNKVAKLKNSNGDYHLIKDVAGNGPLYKLFGQPVLINDVMPEAEAGEKAVAFVNFGEAYATMTKKGLSLQNLSGDKNDALAGVTTLMLDGYMDGKILNPEAIKILKMKTA